MSDMVRAQIIEEVGQSIYFSIMVDETKNISKKRANIACSEIFFE